MFLTTTESQYRDDLLRAENRAELAEEALHSLRQELEAAHRALDSYIGRNIKYRNGGFRLMALCERIDESIETIAKRGEDGWDERRKQMDANEALVADLKALRASFDLVEAENLKLQSRAPTKHLY